MALTLTTSLASTITKSELEGNFASIQEKFNGGIDNSDIRAAAGIAISKLAASKEYTMVSLVNMAFNWNGASEGDAIAMAPLPGLDGTQADWVLTDVNWFCSDGGTGSSPTVDLDLMYYDGNGDIQQRTSLINELTLTRIDNDKGNSSSTTSFASSAVAYDSAEARLLVLRVGATAGGGMGTAIQVGVTLLLERNIQA